MKLRCKYIVRRGFSLFKKIITSTLIFVLVTFMPTDSFANAEQLEEDIEPSVGIEALDTNGGNDYPIILVHGLGGFGRDEFGSIIKMWGGIHDIEQKLRDRGYTVYTATVGPVSSNWDRAVELYYQIKGGTVDYGEAHADEFGHERYGRTFSGLYPEWGEINPETGKPNKVHLIGHSMGGQTIRTLAQLLSEGDARERESSDDASPLFAENQPWVHSALSISTPHDGSTVSYLVNDVIPIIQELVIGAAIFAGNIDQNFYDFKLDHWGIEKREGERFSQYVKRIRQSPGWKSKDTANWDLNPDGAYELNQWVKAQPDVYYFSVSNSQTHRRILSGHHVPEPFMNPFLRPFSRYIGSKTFKREHFTIDRTWWENDGLVSMSTMKGPTIGSSDQIVEYNGHPQKGVWNHLGTMKHFDHLDIIGWGVRDMTDWYEEIAAFLYTLPE